MGTIKINKNNNETNKDKTKLELFIEKQSALQNNEATVQTAKEAEPTALSAAATASATKGLSNGNQIIINNDGVIEFETDFDAGDIYDTYKGMLKVDWQNYGVEEYWATIFIKSGELNIQPNVKTVQLALTSTEFAYGEFRFNDVVCIAEANKTYLFDIKDLVESKDKVQINLRTASDKSTSIEFITKGENAPKIILTYKEDDNDVNKIPNIKDFNLGDKAKGYVDLNNGTFCAQFAPFNSGDFALPLNVSHIYKKGGEWSKCGQNWRLNLNRMLKVAPNDNKNTTLFTYTDEFGNEYDFEEKYYYLDNGQKVFVTKDSVEIDLNGNLTSLGRTVYRHQICNGMTLVSEINDFIKADVVDQRSEKQINLEETIKQYKNTLCDYVIINIDSGIIIYRNHDVSKEIYKETYLKNLENNPQLTLITENSAIQLSTLLSNKESLESQIQEATDANHKAQLNNQLRTQINPQISSIRRQTTRNETHVKEMFETYFNKLEELDFVQLNTPVNYLKDTNGLISGFNKHGNLVCLCNAYGGYVAVEYNKLDQISSIYDDKGKSMSFEYEDDKLASITDCRGRKTTYKYNGKQLTTVWYADGSNISFTYSGEDISTVTDSNGNKSTITYANNKLSRIQTLSHMVKIAKDDVTRGASYTKKIADITFSYTSGGVNINYGEGKSESYTFTSGKNIQSHSQADEIKTKTVTYSYDYSRGKKITEVSQTDVGGEPAVKTIKMYDALDRLLQKIIDWRNISDSVQKRTEYFYFYDNHDNLIGEKCCEFFKKDDNTSSSNTSLKTYSYNAQGSLILTESFVMGEELTSGKNYEERVYDENGNVTKTVKWNSLDSSSKFYSESVISESGLVTAEKDETGEAVSEYEYLDGTNVVKSVKQTNGITVAYGRDPGNFTVTSVTQSTADGESNTNDIIYNCDLPVEVKSGNTVIDYEYDFKGRKTKVTVNGKVQSTSTYEDFEYNQADDKYIFGAKNSSIIAADNETITLVENKTGKLNAATNKMRITEETTLNGYEFNSKEYDEKGRVKKVIDNYSDVNVDYTYNYYGNIVSIEKTKNNVMHLTENYRYNEYGEVSEKHIVGAVNHAYTFGYKQNAARTLEYIRYDNNKFKPLFDVNGRNTGKEITLALGKRIAGEYISYRKVGDHATNMPSVIWYASGDDIKDNLKYKYDKSGNICEITENGHIVAKYAYDGLNRLVREDNKPLNKTVVYTYDNCGNITERCEYAYTRKSGEELTELDCTHFAYEYNGDRLVSYNGERCEYNNLGSPTTYRDKQAQWQFGTRLRSLGAAFNYDGFGRRIKKNNTEFVYDSDGRLIKQSNGLEFIYDDKQVIALEKAQIRYFYRRDVQGNIIALLDERGAVVVRYIYDAWGNHAVVDANGNDIEDMSHIGNVNPFRYRGYYYDAETGLYYLQSRYYDPETGRFISQDSIDYADPEEVNGLNLYAYCGNNPVMNVDPTGKSLIGCLVLLIIGIVASGVINGVVAGANAAEGESFWSAFAGGFVNGVISGIGLAVGLAVAVGGGIGALVVGGIIAAGFGFAGGVAGSAVTQKITYGEVDKNVALIAGAISAGNNLLMFAGLSVAGVYSTAPKFLTRVMQNLLFDVIPVSMSVFWGTLPMLNPNDLRDKFGK